MQIIPPHIIRALAESDDARLRDIGRRNLATFERLAEERAAIRIPALERTRTGRRRIYDAHGTVRLPGRLVRGETGSPSADAAVNHAFIGLGATYDLFAKVFDRDSIDGRGMQLVASVHYGVDYDNAFWNGEQMVFGDGDQIIFAGFTEALEIVGHELTHGITEYSSSLNYRGQSGALNESFSDVFGSLVKQHYLGQDAAAADWLMGVGLLAPGVRGVALRSLKAPGTAYDDPRLGGKDPQAAHMRGYVRLPEAPDTDWGGVHLNSGIPNRAFYLVAMALGGPAWDGAGRIWYETLRGLPPDATFADCAALTIAVAGRRFGSASRELGIVRRAWRTVGIGSASRSTQPAPRRRARPEHRAANRIELASRLDRLARLLASTAEGLRRAAETG